MVITIKGDFDHLIALQRLEELKRFLYITERYLEKAKKEFLEKSYDELGINSYPPDMRDDIYNEELWNYNTKFPRILRNSFFISAYTLLEYEIDVICRRIKKEQLISKNWDVSKPDKLNEAKLYWQHAGLHISFTSNAWNEIKRYARIRNCILHANGLTKEFQVKDKDNLIPYLRKHGIISEDTIDEEIALTKTYCEKIIKTFQYFLNDIYEAIPTAKIKKNKPVQ